MKKSPFVVMEFPNPSYLGLMGLSISETIVKINEEDKLVASSSMTDEQRKAFSEIIAKAKEQLKELQNFFANSEMNYQQFLTDEKTVSFYVHKSVHAALPRAIERLQEGMSQIRHKLVEARQLKLSATTAMLFTSLAEAKQVLEMFTKLQTELVQEGKDAEKS